MLQAAELDPKLEALIRDYSEIAALLTYDAPPVAPSPGLRQKLLNQLPAGSTKSRISSFSGFIPTPLRPVSWGWAFLRRARSTA